MDDAYEDMMKALKDSEQEEVSEMAKSTSTSSVAASRENASEIQSAQAKLPCPPDSRELGRATWTYLHSLAAYFPDKPRESEQREMAAFMGTFSRFYPCWYCADHMQDYMKDKPVTTQTRSAFSLWMCNFHNDVNKNLGKEIFDCKRVDERWLTGCDDS